MSTQEKILVLDDQEIIFTAQGDFYDYELTQVIDKEAFFELLYNGRWTEVWLDHDMGLDRPTGRQITWEINDRFNQDNNDVPMVSLYRVITNNPSASKTMASDLYVLPSTVVITPIYTMTENGVYRGEDFNG